MNKNPFAALAQFFAVIFGRITWQSPLWFNQFRNKLAAQPKSYFVIFFSSILGILALWGVYHWYQHLPHPERVTAEINVPGLTPLDEPQNPSSLLIKFSKSVAPLKMIGKEAKQGITLTPAISGQWFWRDDHELVFTPATDWPADQSYAIHFNKNIFASTVKMEKLDYSFSTHPFTASITEFKFYQDPVDPETREAVATISFSYPVDPNSLEKNISLSMPTLKNEKVDLKEENFKFHITYDKYKRTAYLHSETISLPKVERFLNLILTKGIRTSQGSAVTQKNEDDSVLIPDAGSYFKINNLTATIVRNSQGRPQQVLAIETTLGVTESELNKALHVYLLPQDYPATATEEAKLNYAWSEPGEVTPAILALSTPVNLESIPTDRDFATLHSYQFDAPTPRYLYVKIDNGIHGFGRFELANTYQTVVAIPEYPKEIGFLHKGALLALNSEKKLSVVVRGVPAVKFQIARVLPDDVNHLITQTEGDYSDPHFIDESRFNQNNISDIFSEIQSFNATDLAKEQYTAVDLGKYLASKNNIEGPLGLFLLQATGWDPIKKVTTDVKTNRLILMTDLGLLAKDNSDGTHDVFVQSITTGQPVPNVKVSVLGKNGVPVITGMTDNQGHARFTSLKDFVDEREPTVYLASIGNDVTFMPYNHGDRLLNYSRFDIGGVVSSDQDSQKLSAYVFSDRGIYRPGDTAHIALVVKQNFAAAQPPGLPLELMITDPRGTTIKDEKFTLDATGLFSLDFNTSATAPTGQYVVNLFIVKDKHPSSLLGSTTIRVAEFLPDRMRIKTQLSVPSSEGWISPVDLKATVGLWNLYGAPAADRKVSAKLLLAPQQVYFHQYANYTFVDPLYDPNKPPKTFNDTVGETNTDDQGQAEFDLNLTRFDKATYQLTVFTEGFEADSGRSVTGQTTALISPLAYLIGYHADGDLNFIKQNQSRTVNFIAINPALKQQAVSDLKIQLVALHPVTTLVKNPDGTYQYKSLIQTNVVNTKPFVIDEKGVNYTLPAEQVGDFAIIVLDKNNTELSKVKYSVVGSSQLALAKNAELTVKLNKAEYMPDEEIELQINAPYTGSGLITIERDKVYAYSWFKTDATNSLQKIRIPHDFIGNGYVNVSFIRDWNSPEIFTSPLSFSVIPFKVNHDSHLIQIDLTVPPLAKPGEPFVMNYKSDKPGKIILFAVDEGILQVANYTTPNPADFFFQKNALEVLTYQTVDQILPKFIAARELSAVGGDGGEAALRSNLNPFKRKTDLPVVYWSGVLDTDSTLRQVTYSIPDYFNGMLRVMAVAVASDAVGSATKTAEVRGDFVINPNVPTFVAPGDEFEITASVANNVKNSGKNAAVIVQLDVSSQFDVLGDKKKTLAINEGQEQTVHFKLRAKSELGSANLTLIASTMGKTSKMSSTLSIRPASAYSMAIQSGATRTANQSLLLSRNLYPEYREVNAVMSTNPLILVFGLQRYLENFPFGCTEQLVSKAMPLLALSNEPWNTDKREQVTNKIQATIQMLGFRQMSSGGFSYWPSVGDYQSNTFASIYALHFLLEARGQGFIIPNEMWQAGIKYLKEVATQDVSNLDEARLQAYAIYLLTRTEMVTTNYLVHLQSYLDKDSKQEWKQDITGAYVAATYQLLKSDTTANRLIAMFKPASKKQHHLATFDFYNDSIGDAQYLYLLARHFPDRLKTNSSELVMSLVDAMNNNDINTVFSGYASLALNAYAQFNPLSATSSAEGIAISATLKNDKEQPLTEGAQSYLKVDLSELVKKVNFHNPAKQMYFYQLTQAGFDKTPVTQIIKQGLEITREYQDVQHNVITTTKVGGDIEVHIQVRSLEKDFLSNIAIVDLLPGGFEVIRDSVHAEGMDYVDVREDRVIFFGSINSEAKELVYRIKATNAGKYVVPPLFASAMYNPTIRAQSEAGGITVE